jgi:hypothetical protein
MRATALLLILLTSSSQLPAADSPKSSWVPGPLVQVQPDHSLKEVDEYGGNLPIGHPAFRKLSIRKDPKNNRWIVTGTVCSTNEGSDYQGPAIYAEYPGGIFTLVAMANLKGEVLFSVSPAQDRTQKPIAPTHLYIGSTPSVPLTLPGAILRKYRLRATD